jgi:hypothetical protein
LMLFLTSYNSINTQLTSRIWVVSSNVYVLVVYWRHV